VISELRYRFYDRKPAAVDMREAVLEGLVSRPKRLSPKYFYDEAGSKLFEAITELPEYYPTRTEIALLETHRAEIARRVGAGVCLIEYGSGSSRKIQLLLEELRPFCYVPVDISADHLEESARKIHDEYPWLRVFPMSADFSDELRLPSAVGTARRVAFFPGSSIGNFEPKLALEFMRRVARVIEPGGQFLIGVDRKKDRTILERAYNDATGVTADFNLNVLRHINTAIGADFDTDRFSHVAIYNDELGCVQMFLESTVAQTVQVAGTPFDLAAGERIHTENSFKYDPEEFTRMAENAGFRRETWWTDEQDRFAVYLFAVD